MAHIFQSRRVGRSDVSRFVISTGYYRYTAKNGKPMIVVVDLIKGSAKENYSFGNVTYFTSDGSILERNAQGVEKIKSLLEKGSAQPISYEDAVKEYSVMTAPRPAAVTVSSVAALLG